MATPITAYDKLLIAYWTIYAPFHDSMVSYPLSLDIHNRIARACTPNPPQSQILSRMSSLHSTFLCHLRESQIIAGNLSDVPWEHFNGMKAVFDVVGTKVGQRKPVPSPVAPSPVAPSPVTHVNPWPHVTFSRDHIARLMACWRPVANKFSQVDLALAQRVAQKMKQHPSTTEEGGLSYTPVHVLQKMAEMLQLYHRHLTAVNAAGIKDLSTAGKVWEWFEQMHAIFGGMGGVGGDASGGSKDSNACPVERGRFTPELLTVLMKSWQQNHGSFKEVVDLPLATEVAHDMTALGERGAFSGVEVLQKMAEMMKRYSIELNKMKARGVTDLKEAREDWRWFEHMHGIFGGLSSSKNQPTPDKPTSSQNPRQTYEECMQSVRGSSSGQQKLQNAENEEVAKTGVARPLTRAMKSVTGTEQGGSGAVDASQQDDGIEEFNFRAADIESNSRDEDQDVEEEEDRNRDPDWSPNEVAANAPVLKRSPRLLQREPVNVKLEEDIVRLGPVEQEEVAKDHYVEGATQTENEDIAVGANQVHQTDVSQLQMGQHLLPVVTEEDETGEVKHMEMEVEEHLAYEEEEAMEAVVEDIQVNQNEEPATMRSAMEISPSPCDAGAPDDQEERDPQKGIHAPTGSNKEPVQPQLQHSSSTIAPPIRRSFEQIVRPQSKRSRTLIASPNERPVYQGGSPQIQNVTPPIPPHSRAAKQSTDPQFQRSRRSIALAFKIPVGQSASPQIQRSRHAIISSNKMAVEQVASPPAQRSKRPSGFPNNRSVEHVATPQVQRLRKSIASSDRRTFEHGATDTIAQVLVQTEKERSIVDERTGNSEGTSPDLQLNSNEAYNHGRDGPAPRGSDTLLNRIRRKRTRSLPLIDHRAGSSATDSAVAARPSSMAANGQANGIIHSAQTPPTVPRKMNSAQQGLQSNGVKRLGQTPPAVLQHANGVQQKSRSAKRIGKIGRRYLVRNNAITPLEAQNQLQTIGSVAVAPRTGEGSGNLVSQKDDHENSERRKLRKIANGRRSSWNGTEMNGANGTGESGVNGSSAAESGAKRDGVGVTDIGNLEMRKADLEIRRRELELKQMEIAMRFKEVELRQMEFQVRREETEVQKAELRIEEMRMSFESGDGGGAKEFDENVVVIRALRETAIALEGSDNRLAARKLMDRVTALATGSSGEAGGSAR